MRTTTTLLAFAMAVQPMTGWPAEAAGSVPEAQAPTAYWRERAQGWFWYRDPPQAPAARSRKESPAAANAFEAMQQHLESLKREAVMNPTDENLTAYMRYQRLVMDKAQLFAQRWQKLVWSTPDLDYALTGRPTNAAAIGVYDEQQKDAQANAVRSLAATHGLIFVFRGDCPYCHRMAPILRRFEQELGMSVLAVSLDGGALPEYPDPRRDNGIAARLHATVVPALYLTNPATREITPVGFGLMAHTDLLERIAQLATADTRESP